MATGSPLCELHLCPSADGAWTRVVRPWLATSRDRLERRFVLVPTRGQAHGLKQRCVVEGVPLLGVEFLTPGLAREKWRAVARPDRPALDRRLLELGLHAIILRRRAAVSGAAPDAPERGVLRSLQSDTDRALGAFEELARAGFESRDFEHPVVRAVFEELEAWVRSTGYDTDPDQVRRAALATLPSGAPRAGGALLVYALTAEDWGSFFTAAAFARHCGATSVVLPEPALRGRGLDEGWVSLWEDFLGVEATLHADDDPGSNGAGVGQVLTGDLPPTNALDFDLIVGRTAVDEISLVARKIESLLESGADRLAVIFPSAESGHRRLAALLASRGVAAVDLLATPGGPAIETRTQRALLGFFQRGGRLEEFLELWPLLRALGWAKVPLGAARTVCEQLFGDTQTHLLAAGLARLVASERPEGQAVRELGGRLLPAWPAELSVADAVERFGRVCGEFRLPLPSGWSELASFAGRDRRLLPLALVTTTLAAFLPDGSPTAGVGRGGFARVTLTTRRRAAGLAWSQVIFTGATAGSWPVRVESGPWLTDEHRTRLNTGARFSLGLLTRGDRVQLERDAYAAIVRNTRGSVIFSAALSNDQEPELKQAPNVWVERLLFWQNARRSGWSLEKVWESMARSAAPEARRGGSDGELERWLGVWVGRRDPKREFDDHFYCTDPAAVRPAHLPAGLIERGFKDPVELWYEAVLGLRAVDWRPFSRAARRWLGQVVHRLLAKALRAEEHGDGFLRLPSPAECRMRLEQARAAWRRDRPTDCYWDSLHAELAQQSRELLDKLLQLDGGRYAVVEWTLPRGVAVAVGRHRVEIRGRIDVALADRAQWAGSGVDIVDFKTGANPPLSAGRMSKSGDGLQLAVYLAAVRTLGAMTGRVWQLKAEPGGESALTMDELDAALAPAARVVEHLASGKYGQLTPDRREHTRGFEPPLACVPIPHAVLAEKFRRTFAGGPASTEDDDE